MNSGVEKLTVFPPVIPGLCVRPNLHQAIEVLLLLEFQKAGKQRTTKPIFDYFQRVLQTYIMHVLLKIGDAKKLQVYR